MDQVEAAPEHSLPDPPRLRSGIDVERELLQSRPGAARLAAAALRRKRLLSALGHWRSSLVSQSHLAGLLGCAQPDISRLELGKVDPRTSTLERFAAALGANFIWQVVDDYGVPVTDDFTWSEDVQFARTTGAESLVATHDVRDCVGHLAWAVMANSPEMIARAYAPHAVLHIPGGSQVVGRDEITRYRSIWADTFDQAQWIFDTPIADGRDVVTSGRLLGIPTRGLGALDLDPRGLLERSLQATKRVELAFQERFRVEQEGIVEDVWLFDRADLIEQLSAQVAYA